MTDATDSITASIEDLAGEDLAGSKRSLCGIANLKVVYSVIACFRILWVIALCAAVCLTAAAAYAQQFSANDFAPATAKPANGWWSPERTAFAVVAPHLQINMSQLTRFENSAAMRPSATQPNNYPDVNPAGFELSTYEPGIPSSSFAEGELLSPESFLSLIGAKYVKWESSLADTRSLTSVNGVAVYPLIQIDYAHWHLPVSLYAPPLRGSNAG